jgi:chromosome segregation ATPase
MSSTTAQKSTITVSKIAEAIKEVVAVSEQKVKERVGIASQTVNEHTTEVCGEILSSLHTMAKVNSKILETTTTIATANSKLMESNTMLEAELRAAREDIVAARDTIIELKSTIAALTERVDALSTLVDSSSRAKTDNALVHRQGYIPAVPQRYTLVLTEIMGNASAPDGAGGDFNKH